VEEAPTVAPGFNDKKAWRLQADMAKTAGREQLNIDTAKSVEVGSPAAVVASTQIEDQGPASDSCGARSQVRGFWDYKAELKAQIVALEERYARDMAAKNKELADKDKALADKAKELAALNAELDALRKKGNSDPTPGSELDVLRKKNAELVSSYEGFAAENELLFTEAAQLDVKVARLQKEKLAAETKLSEALAEAKKKEVNMKRRETRSTKKSALAREKEEQAAAREEENRRLKSHLLALTQRNMELQSELDDFTIRGKARDASAILEKGDGEMV